MGEQAGGWTQVSAGQIRVLLPGTAAKTHEIPRIHPFHPKTYRKKGNQRHSNNSNLPKTFDHLDLVFFNMLFRGMAGAPLTPGESKHCKSVRDVWRKLLEMDFLCKGSARPANVRVHFMHVGPASRCCDCSSGVDLLDNQVLSYQGDILSESSKSVTTQVIRVSE